MSALAGRRGRAIEAAFAEEIVFSDPDGTVVGGDALERKAAGLRDGATAEFVAADRARVPTPIAAAGRD
jgi:hypothetical protein